MNDVAIRAVRLSKQFQIGAHQENYRTLRDTVASVATAPVRLIKSAFSRSGTRTPRVRGEQMWALSDLTFDVKRGEVLGVIGRNGAGKSTLLKTLSRISEPTSGYAEIHGRVGSLLEVGTGFHQELTGRENIFLNGAILGMKKVDIARRFDEIVAFAEVQRFVDTPVKHYSTGMYLRLAFAVAAHLEPEILLVDEVLAVGDAAFQRKCIGKMGEVAKQGRTILFVSHNMGAIRSLCTSGLVLEQGQLLQSGDIASAVETYYKLLTGHGEAARVEPGVGADAEIVTRSAFGPISISNRGRAAVGQSESLTASTVLSIADEVSGFSLYCIVQDMHGRQIFHLREESSELGLSSVPPGRYAIKVTVPPLWLVPGVYALSFKTQLWGGRGKARVVSDVFPLDVDGENSMTEAVLHPQVLWDVQPVSQLAVQY